MAGIGFCWMGITVAQSYLNPWAQSHGLSPAQAGTVFSVQPFAVVLVQAFIPCLARRCGRGNLLTAGLCLSSASQCGFALMPSIVTTHGGHALFTGLVSAAVVAGLGEGVVETCTYTLLQEVFPDVVGQVTGHVEAWIGIGVVFGPVIGGFLYELAGFSLPPAVIAAALLILAVVCCTWSIRRARTARELQSATSMASTPLAECRIGSAGGAVADGPSNEAEEAGPYRRDVAVFLFALGGVFASGFVGGCLAPLMSYHWVEGLGWAESTVGLIISAWGVIYMAMAVLAGTLCDRGPRFARTVFSIGSLSSATGLFVIGQTALPPAVSVSGVLLLGIADAFLIVPGLSLLRQSAPNREDSFVAALLNGCFSLGLGAGPLLAVPLSKHIGLRSTMESVAAVGMALGIALTAVMAARPCPAPCERGGESGAGSSVA
eukprot:CAMPEP_0171189454 /NCGR_PEP_ID=MMETSP0790-20130122/18354_1 /TAXON_ID=2925 /ORGANISM="Alexandrium catenella, Strain OF101" /LENGTH=432 /DNA_ID=CAMNT_0011654565 /DNA_START=65 /DNA_END=1363 /DNA_ORIENTATION=-